MSYIRDVANLIKSYMAEGDVPTDSDALFLVYAVLALSKGQAVTIEDVHNAWSAWMVSRGENHESLIPFNELPEKIKEKDRPYVEAIRKAGVTIESTYRKG